MKIVEGMRLKGTFTIVHRDKNGKILSKEKITNLVTNEGFDYMLNTALHGGSAISAWYFAPWKTNTAPVVGDTYASPTNTEADAEISEGTRQEWAEGASSGQSVTGATAAKITAASNVTIYGAGIVGGGTAATTKADTAGGGTLFASALFSAAKTLAAGESLDLTYTVSKA